MSKSVSLQNFAKHSSIYALGSIINRLGAFILLPVYTNYLTTTQYGVLELLYVTASLLTSFLGMSFSHACLRFYFEYDEADKRKQVIGTTLISSFVITGVGVVSLIPFVGDMSEFLFDTLEYQDLFYFTFLIFVLSMSNEICYAYFRAKEYSLKFIVSSTLQFIIQVATNIYTVVFLDMGIQGVLIGNLLATITIWIYLATITVKENRLTVNGEILKGIMLYTYPFILSSIAVVISANVDKYIIKSSISLGAVGIFALSQKFSMLLEELFSGPFKKNFSPFRFSIMKRDDVGHLLSKLLNYYAMGLAFFALSISFFVPDILRVMSSEEFWPAAAIVPILLFALVFEGIGYVFQTGIMYSKKTRYFMYIRVSSAILLILANVILIPLWNVEGAAISRVLIGVFAAVLTLYYSQRVHQISFEFKALFKVIFILLFVYFAFYIVPVESWQWLIAIKISLLMFFVFLLRKSGALTSDDMKNIMDFLRNVVSKMGFIRK